MAVIHSDHDVDIRVGVLDEFDFDLMFSRIPFNLVRLNLVQFG